MKPNLILLTTQFPSATAKAENWLCDELAVTNGYYNHITIIPSKYDENQHPLPSNCTVVNVDTLPSVALSFSEVWNSFRIVLSDFFNYPSKLNYIKSFRYNLSLIKQLHIKAKKISTNKDWFNSSTIGYAYWADDLATAACIIAQRYHSIKVITRAHGYEVFEEQTKNNVIAFRAYQYRFVTHLFTDSKRGYEHLKAKIKNGLYLKKVNYSYVGTADCGIGVFDEKAEFAIVTCSYIRGVKRLLLMPNILKNCSFPLTWHVLGDGEDLPALKVANQKLPKNISVVYHGSLSNQQILDFYKSTSLNLFVSLSSSEGLPVSMMEAQSFGIPIMSTNVGGCSEICNEQTGFLIDKNFNPKEVAQQLEVFKNSEKNSLNFKRKCRLFWETHFNADTNYTNFAKLIITN